MKSKEHELLLNNDNIMAACSCRHWFAGFRNSDQTLESFIAQARLRHEGHLSVLARFEADLSGLSTSGLSFSESWLSETDAAAQGWKEHTIRSEINLGRLVGVFWKRVAYADRADLVRLGEEWNRNLDDVYDAYAKLAAAPENR